MDDTHYFVWSLGDSGKATLSEVKVGGASYGPARSSRRQSKETGFKYCQQAGPVELCKSAFLAGPFISQQSGRLPTLVMKHGNM